MNQYFVWNCFDCVCILLAKPYVDCNLDLKLFKLCLYVVSSALKEPVLGSESF